MVPKLGVVVGYKCNFQCAHCCVRDCGPISLTLVEKNKIGSVIVRHAPRSILFVGGEPTLYLDDINEILSYAKDLSGITIKITTNGHFAVTVAAAVRVLKSFLKVDSVQLSYDSFHAEFLPFRRVKNLYRACKTLGIKFCVINTISSPLDLAGLKKIKSVGEFKILINKVMNVGAALHNGIKYHYPSFDRRVLRKKCSLRGGIGYICGRGFSLCCSNLVYEAGLPVAHESVGQHKGSRFYRLISSMTFGELLKKARLSSVDLPPEFSTECNLCEYVFKSGRLIR